jgi:hypothetical protein
VDRAAHVRISNMKRKSTATMKTHDEGGDKKKGRNAA